MSHTKWWKCDLQVATPAWDFKFPPGSNYRIDTAQGREQFLDDYMNALKKVGIEVVALADHNTGEWIDAAKAAGKRNGVVVFPGCEITTHTGSDGVHLLIIGDLHRTSQDFDRLLHGPLGFNEEHPPFRDNQGSPVPGSSSKTLIQILDALPEGYLAIAPHACNENGIVSSSTVKGDLRWKSLHHERLVALDPGDCSNPNGDGFADKFRRRALEVYPRLSDLAFVSTSDAYCFADLGTRFTWIRIGAVGLEGLRQAFLDHESRVLCDWSPELANFIDRNPNNIRHAWISEVTLAGNLGNSSAPITIPFHPNLNVIIGGRGSGKSSIVAALRQLYSNTDTLPFRLKDEADGFVDSVFTNANLKGVHRIQESQEVQTATWDVLDGSEVVELDGTKVRTNFPVTVISQKELFERAAGDKNDPHLSSRSLLALLDSRIGYGAKDTKSLGSFGRRLEDARANWANAARDFELMKSDLDQLSGLKSQEAMLQKQVNAFTSPEVEKRLERINSRQKERAFLELLYKRLQLSLTKAEELVVELNHPPRLNFEVMNPYSDDYKTIIGQLTEISENLSKSISLSLEENLPRIENFADSYAPNKWNIDSIEATKDLEAYKEQLAAMGLSTTEFSRLQIELKNVAERIRNLEALQTRLEPAKENLDRCWDYLIGLIVERRTSRQELLTEIESRSKRLRFKTSDNQDTSPWVEGFRSSCGFRADAYIEDVPNLAKWLWCAPALELLSRWEIWRHALASGDMKGMQNVANLRPAFADRLSSLDEQIRLRLGTLIPDDIVMMEFLKEGGRPDRDSDWQSVTQGSPGQRTAAMLAFVLHHGREPLILDQPEDDLDSEWISRLVVKELRQSRWSRQLIVVSHNANIPVLGDAEQVVALENSNGALKVRESTAIDNGLAAVVPHIGPVENEFVRNDIQSIMEGGVAAFVKREQRYNNETRQLKMVS